MLRSILGICIAAIAILGCQNHDKQTVATRFHEDGRAKPVVLVTPVIDSTSSEFSWSLSEEFSSTIQQRIARKGGLFLSNSSQTETPFYNNNPFSQDISWIKESYPAQEFIVFLELVEHDNVPADGDSTKNISDIEKIKNISTNLNMAVRLRIVDIRGEKPRLVLQELLTDSYYISKNHIDTDYSRVIWGMDEYTTSPMGMAHNQLAKEIAERIYDYIIIAQSR